MTLMFLCYWFIGISSLPATITNYRNYQSTTRTTLIVAVPWYLFVQLLGYVSKCKKPFIYFYINGTITTTALATCSKESVGCSLTLTIYIFSVQNSKCSKKVVQVEHINTIAVYMQRYPIPLAHTWGINLWQSPLTTSRLLVRQNEVALHAPYCPVM